MKILEFAKWISLVICCIGVVALCMVSVSTAFNNYLDTRINRAIRIERRCVYDDLAKLHPDRVRYTRYGMAYFTEE